MRVCDRCRIPEKKSVKTLRDQHGGEVELCRECDGEFLRFLDNAPASEVKKTSQGNSGKR